jgi:hypothetical protein
MVERLANLEARFSELESVYGKRLDMHAMQLRELSGSERDFDLRLVRGALTEHPVLLEALERLLSSKG